MSRQFTRNRRRRWRRAIWRRVKRGPLRLLMAGLLELLPWLHQCHSNVDPAQGVSPAEFIEALVDAECPELRLSRVDLETTRMSESAGAPSGIADLETKKSKATAEVR